MTAEVDGGEGTVRVAGVLTVLGLFLMRSCFSGGCFVMAFESQSQQAFLEGHVHALDWFSGAFTTIRYDNLKSAAKKALEGRHRGSSCVLRLSARVRAAPSARGRYRRALPATR
ncbi:MAG: hypothetical protein ABSH51_30135 [Solirubrobacteraceae bacterium]